MSATFTVNQDRWKSAVGDLQRLVANSSRAIVKDQSKKLVATCIKLTPPTYNKATRAALADEQAKIGAGTSDKALGERKLLKDLLRIFQPMKREFLESAVAANGNPIETKHFTGKDGKRWFIEKAYVGFSFDDAKAFHRDKWKTGRLSQSGMRDRNIGRWVPFDTMLLPFEVFNAFLAYEIKQVGSMKGGWAVAGETLGMTVPNWINRHEGRGRIVVNQLANAVAPSFYFANRAKNITDIRPRISDAMRIRAEAIGKDIKRRIQYGPGKRGFHFIEGIE